MLVRGLEASLLWLIVLEFLATVAPPRRLDRVPLRSQIDSTSFLLDDLSAELIGELNIIYLDAIGGGGGGVGVEYPCDVAAT